MKLQQLLNEIEVQDENEVPVKLNDVCLKPLYPDSEACAIMSAAQYFQNDPETLDMFSDIEDFQSQLKKCMKAPATPEDPNNPFEPGCLSGFGAPVNPSVVYGDFNTTSDDALRMFEASVLIITIPLPNTKDELKLKRIKNWESAFLTTLHTVKDEWIEVDRERVRIGNDDYVLNITYSAERSIEDELDRQSHGDAMTVVVSYFIMFLFGWLNSLYEGVILC